MEFTRIWTLIGRMIFSKPLTLLSNSPSLSLWTFAILSFVRNRFSYKWLEVRKYLLLINALWLNLAWVQNALLRTGESKLFWWIWFSSAALLCCLASPNSSPRSGSPRAPPPLHCKRRGCGEVRAEGGRVKLCHRSAEVLVHIDRTGRDRGEREFGLSPPHSCTFLSSF